MKTTVRKTILKWTAWMLSASIFLMILPAGAFAADDEQVMIIYKDGETDDSHSAENDPIGSPVLKHPLELEDGRSDYGALVLLFPDGEGGADVTMKTGDLTCKAGPSMKEVHYGEPEYGLDSDCGTYTRTFYPYGAVIRLDDGSTLNIETGVISNIVGDAALITVDDGSELILDAAAVNANENGMKVESNLSNPENPGTTIVITTGDVTTGMQGIEMNAANSDMTLTVDGNLRTGTEGMTLANSYGGSVEAKVTGEIEAGGVAIGVSLERDSTGTVEAGTVSGGSGVSLYTDFSSLNVTVKEVIAGGNGVGIQNYDNSEYYGDGESGEPESPSETENEGGEGEQEEKKPTIVFSAKSITAGTDSENCYGGEGLSTFTVDRTRTEVTIDGDVSTAQTGRGVYVLNGEVRWPDEPVIKSETLITVGGDVTAGGTGVYIQNNCGDVTADIGGDVINNGDSHYEYGVFIKTDEYSGTEFTAESITSCNGVGARIHAEGKGASISAGVGNVSAAGVGLSIEAESEGSRATVTAADVFSENESAMTVTAERGDLYSLGTGGDIEAEAESLTSETFHGLYGSVKDGTVSVKAKTVSGGYSGVDVSLSGSDKEKGMTAQAESLIYGKETGISVYTSELYIDRYDDEGYWTGSETYSNENYARISTSGSVCSDRMGIQVRNLGGEVTIGVGDEKEDGLIVVTERPGAGQGGKEITGILAENSNGSTSISISGDLNVYSVPENAEAGGASAGIDTNVAADGVKIGNYGGKIDIGIAGDMNVQEGTGIRIIKDYFTGNDGQATLTVGGSLNAENGIAMDVNGDGDGHAEIVITGDLVSTGTGIKIGQEEQYAPGLYAGGEAWQESGNEESSVSGTDEKPPAVDIIVRETISGLIPILVSNMEAVKNTLITTWAVKPNENSRITEDADGNAVEDLEKNINYIIKKEDNEYGTLSVGGTTEKKISETEVENEGKKRGETGGESADSNTLDVAKQKTELTLSVNLKDEYKTGYEVIIYNGKGEAKQIAEVKKQENGYFIFEVPWAGGVYLSFGLKQLTGAGPGTEPENEPENQPGEEPGSEPDHEPRDESGGDPNPETDPEPDPDRPHDDNPPAAIIAGNGVTDTGSGRILAIIYGEDEAYTIWFTSGYSYKARFADGHTETGSYSVRGGTLELKSAESGRRTIIDRKIAFGENREAELCKADFSDSVKIIGEFNMNEEGNLVITDGEGTGLSLAGIRSGIDNPYAYEILASIVKEEKTES